MDVQIRRIDFRHGTDAELGALHAVESAIEAERRPARTPQPLDSYIAFARNLPTQFRDHSWLVEASDGTPVATGACWSNSAGDQRIMECDLFVVRDRRREGIGARLMHLVCDVSEAEGQSLLTWGTFDSVPAGEAFSRHLGATVARVNRASELRLAAVDWAMVDRWVDEGPTRAPGYRLEWIDGAMPPALRADAATFHHIMNTQPHDDLDVGDTIIDETNVAELDVALLEAGRDRWSIFVRDPSGTCVGGTEIHIEPWEPGSLQQNNTGIDPDHRGHGLAKWAKAAMLQRIRAEMPLVERVFTGNAFSNAPMLAINDALGFEVIASRTEWQAAVPDVSRALRAR